MAWPSGGEMAERIRASDWTSTRERQAFLLQLSDALMPLTQPLEVQHTAARLLGEHMQVGRAFYFSVRRQGDDFVHVVEQDYHSRPDMVGMAGDYSQQAYDQGFHIGLQGGRTAVVRDVQAGPDLTPEAADFHAGIQAAAWIAAPLIKGGEYIAGFVVMEDRPRDWTADEMTLVEEVAERTWAATERARTETSLRESEEKYRNLFDTMGNGYAELELVRDAGGKAVDYRLISMNPAFGRLIGIPVAQARGRSVREIIPDLEEWWVETLERAARTGRPETVEREVPLLNRWYEVHIYPRNGDRIATLFDDITDRKRAEQVLRDSDEQQRFLLKLSDAMRAEESPDAIIAVATRMLGEQLGATRVVYAEIDEEAGIARIREGWAAAGAERHPASLALSDFGGPLLDDLRAGKTVRYDDVGSAPFARPDLAALDAIGVKAGLSAPLIVGGRFVININVHQDRPRRWTDVEVMLTEAVGERTWAAVQRACAETALRASERRFRQFGEASSDVLWIRDAETVQWEYLSDAFRAVYGQERDEALTANTLRNWLDLIVPEDREHAVANIRRVREGERVTFEYRIRRPSDGEMRWLRNTDFPLFDEAGRVQRIGGIGHDATEEKEAADRLHMLVAELQHRTRNLIAVVRGLADKTLQESASLDDFQARYGERLKAVSRVQGLLSRLGEGQRITFDEMLRTELLAHGALDGLADRVTLEGPEGVRLRSGTVQTFALAVHELATNAVKYGALSPNGGRLEVRWRVHDDDEEGPRLHVDWHESGVDMRAAGAAPHGGGYGRELIERALPYQLKAKTTYEIAPDGVRCTIAVPISEAGALQDTKNG